MNLTVIVYKSKFLKNDTLIFFSDCFSFQPRQPLLVSRPTEKDIRGGKKTPCNLIPELCRLTGLDDTMRENHQLMRAMADHTRVSPEGRIEKLLNFNRRLHSKPAIAEELQAWNLTLSKNLVEIDGRILPMEKISAANRETYPAENREYIFILGF